MTVALQEPRACHTADKLRPFTPPADDVWRTTEGEAPHGRRTILSQLLALCGGPEGRAIDTQWLRVRAKSGGLGLNWVVRRSEQNFHMKIFTPSRERHFFDDLSSIAPERSRR